jgi:acyl-CoA thioester hydrolase
MHVIFHHPHTVLSDEIDGQGHASNVAYLVWMQSAAVAHSTANGWSPQRYQEAGMGWVARTHRIDYLRPAFEGESLVVETWVSGFRNVSSTRRYEILRTTDGVLLAKAETRWAFVAFPTGKPLAIPESLRQAFSVADRE